MDNVDGYKACLVVKSFTQMDGIDFEDTHSISSKDTFRMVMTLVAHFYLEL